MKISIILSIYNGEKYLVEQLDSIRLQKRRSDEVLIFDDCSTDSSYSLVDEYIKEFHLTHWILKRNIVNKGWKRNFHDGVLLCTGDIIFLSDQDDIWSIDKLFDIEKIMNENDYINVLATYYSEFSNNGLIKKCFNNIDNSICQMDYNNRFFRVPFPGCTFCLRRKYIEKINKFWKTEYSHDAFLWRISMIDGTAYFLKKVLISQRKHYDSAFQADNRKSRNFHGKLKGIELDLKTLRSIEDYINSINISDKNSRLLRLEQYKKWCKLRKKFYLSKNPLIGIVLLLYLNYYSKNKQYFGDWVITYFWKV